MPKSRFEWVLVLVVVINMLCWIGLGCTILHWGGEAGSGTVRAGHYFLGRPSYQEVSRGLFMASLWDVRCLLASQFLMMLLFYIQHKRQLRAGQRIA